jgi:drug/metabolite transporter (DMT)-like permease
LNLKSKEFSAQFAAVLAGLSFGVVPIFSAFLRDLDVSSIEQSFIRLIIGSIAGMIVVAFFSKSGKLGFETSLQRPFQKVFIFQGILVALSLNFYLASIVLETPVGEAALLCQIHPLVTFLFAWFLLKESITKNKIISLILALCGIIFLTQPWQWTSFLSSFTGSMLALLSGVGYSMYLIVGSYSVTKNANISPLLSIAWILFWAFVMWIPILLLAQALNLPSEITNFDLMTYTSLRNLLFGIGLGTIGNIIPFGLIMYATNRIESSRISILLLSEPIGAMVLGSIFLEEAITILYILGGFFVLTAVILIISQSQERVKRTVDPPHA